MVSEAGEVNRIVQDIARCTAAIRQLQSGAYALDAALPALHDATAPLCDALNDLAVTLQRRAAEGQHLDSLLARMNAGLLLDDILLALYADFRDLIPYNRIGFSLITDDGAHVVARWANTDQPHVFLRRGYEAPLAGSSLQTILDTGQPRILNDLRAYLDAKPESESTALIVQEGIQSSLTCPLVAEGRPVGFIFFSSVERYAYDTAHIDIFQRIAGHLGIIVERGRMVSELAEQKRAIERQNQELERLNELRNTFTGMAAHDLRSPLGIIEMAMAFLLDGNLDLSDEDLRLVLRDVEHQAHHMLALIDDLLDVTQIQAGRLELQRTVLDLDAYLDEAVRRNARLAEPKGTRVILDENSGGGTVYADTRRLRQVVDNLISNAVKYAPTGSTVTVAAAPTRVDDGSGWRISVQDEGPGIQPDERPYLFQEFGRLSSQPTGGERSIGLGLAISRRVVEAHGGQIGVDSEPGHGATFWFTLPAAPDGPDA